MKEVPVLLSPREQQIAELLLQGCDNAEIAKQINMARRTVKAHFNRLFLRFGIHDGIKRVKLATLLYRGHLRSEGSVRDAPGALILADVERGNRNISILNLELIANGLRVSLAQLFSRL